MTQWLQRIAITSGAVLGIWAFITFIVMTVLGVDQDTGLRFVNQYRVDIILAVIFGLIALWGYAMAYRSVSKFSEKVHCRVSSIERVILEGQISNFYRWHIMQAHEFTDMDARELYSLESRRIEQGLNGYNERRMELLIEALERQHHVDI